MKKKMYINRVLKSTQIDGKYKEYNRKLWFENHCFIVMIWLEDYNIMYAIRLLSYENITSE